MGGQVALTDLNDVYPALQNVLHRIAHVLGTREIAAEDLFSRPFMREYTGFGSFDEMVAAAGMQPAKWLSELDANPEWHQFVRAMSRFRSWAEMKQAALQEWLADQLGFSGVRHRQP